MQQTVEQAQAAIKAFLDRDELYNIAAIVCPHCDPPVVFQEISKAPSTKKWSDLRDGKFTQADHAEVARDNGNDIKVKENAVLGQLIAHMASQHKGQTGTPCPICGKDVKELAKHLATHRRPDKRWHEK